MLGAKYPNPAGGPPTNAAAVIAARIDPEVMASELALLHKTEEEVRQRLRRRINGTMNVTMKHWSIIICLVLVFGGMFCIILFFGPRFWWGSSRPEASPLD